MGTEAQITGTLRSQEIPTLKSWQTSRSFAGATRRLMRRLGVDGARNLVEYREIAWWGGLLGGVLLSLIHI